MKRISALMLAILLLLTRGLALAEETTEAAEPRVYEELVVGNPTKMQGYFFTELWGNSTTDIDVRMLLHGYNLVVWNSEKSMFSFNPTVVNEVMPMTDQAGDETFALILANDLRYSDGSRITAWDYAFSFLLQISPEIADFL